MDSLCGGCVNNSLVVGGFMSKINRTALELNHKELLRLLAELLAMRDRCFIPNAGDWWDDAAESAVKKGKEFYEL